MFFSLKFKVFIIISSFFVIVLVSHMFYDINKSKQGLTLYFENLNTSSGKLLNQSIKSNLYNLNFTNTKLTLSYYDNEYFENIYILNKDGYIFAERNSDEIEVKVRYPEKDRQNPTDVINAHIRTADGTVVPLSSVATVSYGYTKDSITRINGKRAVYISADVDKEAISSTELVSLIQREVVPDIASQYPSLGIHFGGEAEQQAETQSSMVQMFILALLVIYMLLAIPLKSYFQPVIIMVAIPFGIVGAIIGHWVNDLPLGILSLNGIIALSGVVVNDSLLLVARFNEIRKETQSTTKNTP